MKVLFLDCDGVLNTKNSWNTIYDIDTYYSIHVLNRDLVDRLLKIIEDTGCRIVLSSTWRLTDRGTPFLEKNGIEVYSETDSNDGCRGAQIGRWLASHPQVTSYSILDDDADMLTEQLPYLVLTDPEFGLTDTIAYRATYMLNH